MRKLSEIASRIFCVNTLIWVMIIALLAVLMPHTAWYFGRFEGQETSFLAWPLAFVFEGSIAIFMHKLSQHIEKTPLKKGKPWYAIDNLVLHYVNAYAAGLCTFVAFSVLANVSHAMAFAQDGYSNGLLVATAGGVLPIASLLFARVLSQVNEEQDEQPNLQEEITKLQNRLARAQSEVQTMKARESELQAKAAIWDKFNPVARETAKYLVGLAPTMEEAAKSANTSASTISRLASQMNHGETK